MPPSDYLKVSPYAIMVTDQLSRWIGEGVTSFNQQMLCEKIGRRVTASMRRCLAELEAAGIVIRYRYCTERGGIAIGYGIVKSISLDEYKAELPF